MEVRDVWHRRMTEYYQEIDRKLNAAPKTGLLTTLDNQARAELEKSVNNLHQVARLVEVHIGQGLLSRDIRSAADRLNKQLTGITV